MENLDNQMIDAMRQSLSTRRYPGYPEQRLFMDIDEIPENLTLPEGPWATTVNTMPSLEEQDRLRQEGMELDSLGRPLHPWLLRMLTDPDIGVVTGMGKYWHWGPNRAADPIVITSDDIPKILLILRSDSRIWALPGGFIDPGETAVQAAKRELFEEAGLLLLGDDGRKIYSGVIGDLRSTAHAWGETTATLWQVPTEIPVVAGDDALDAGWFDVNNLPEAISRQHEVLIKKALAETAFVDTLSSAIAFPVERKTYSRAGGGHMAYQRFIIHNNDGSEHFLKGHDKGIFTDGIREQNSRNYLHKEKLIYDHLTPHVPELIPATVTMIDNHSLIMEALTPDKGWNWRAPTVNTERYIDEIIAGLSIIQSIPMPDDSTVPIRPTYHTYAIEGWDTIGSDKMHRHVQAKIHEFLPQMHEDFQNVGKELTENLERLIIEFEELSDPDEFYFAHHDLRQSNVAWHPALGTKIIDWSWAGIGRKDSDATSLLIDLHKSGHNIDKHMAYFNPDHALTLIGFWLGHSLWPTRTDDQSVRFHQVTSAVSAYDLLMKYRKR